MKFIKKRKLRKLKEHKKRLLSMFTIRELSDPSIYQSIKTALIRIDRAVIRVNG